ncbi:gluconokinase [Neomegalonema perideroedes]|uniref:gluconokinase n=1 Tax=Neomegalonema perideroedes TaxID=217219 RepID=UPI000364338E|nr:gluconokinase [Neomegalonema perideroedes]
MTRAVILMGPSGVGKTTLGEALAARLGWPFLEGDDLHPPENRAKMTRGIPLDDADRAPWLAALRDRISEEAARAPGLILACSALKRRYRDLLREARAEVRFLELTADPALIGERLSQRRGHFMPASLLASQLAALEPLAPDEPGARISVSGSAEAVMARACAALGL